MTVIEHAEAPIGKTTTAHADKVHDAVTCGTHFRPGDLGEDGHVVAIKETPTNAEENE